MGIIIEKKKFYVSNSNNKIRHIMGLSAIALVLALSCSPITVIASPLKMAPPNQTTERVGDSVMQSEIADSNLEQLKSKSELSTDKKMEEWRDNRFGMFIHWGPYAQAEGMWNGVSVDEAYLGNIYRPNASGEWFFQWKWKDMADIEFFSQCVGEKLAECADDYTLARTFYIETYADNFEPLYFNAEDIADRAEFAGMKYIVVTAKHHDGFSMFDTAMEPDQNGTYEYLNLNQGHDPVAELKEACEARGLMFGIYYSIWDWYHPAFKPDDQTGFLGWTTTGGEESKNEYMAYMKEQLKELISGYRPDIIWFDGSWPSWCGKEEEKEIRDHVMSLDPDIIINDRAGNLGHYATPEQGLSPRIQEHDWEACMTMNDTWGYKKEDHNWKSTGTLIRLLVTAASRGGNFLLNIGPDKNGEIPPASAERITEIGDWMTKFSESIHGTEGVYSGYRPENVRMTQKDNKLYVHILNGASSDAHENSATYSWKSQITIGRVTNYLRAYSLEDPKTSLSASFNGNRMTIKLPDTAPDPHCAVVVIECNGKPTFEIPAIQPDYNRVQIEAEDYVGKSSEVGGCLTIPSGEGGDAIGHIWMNAWLDYDVSIQRDGVYLIEYRTATRNKNMGRLDFMAHGATLASTTIPQTGNWETYTNSLAAVNLTKGLQRIRLYASGPFFNLNHFSITYVGDNYNYSQIVPGKIEAEDYDWNNGLIMWPCDDGEDGYMMGDAHLGDNIGYHVLIQSGGQYAAEFRIAAPYPDGVSKASFDIHIDGNPDKVATVHVPNTGGYNDFMTVVSDRINFSPGYHTIEFRVGGEWGHYNMNWFKFSKIMPDLTAGAWTLEAESFDAMNGMSILQRDESETHSDYFLGQMDEGDWVEYKIFSPYEGDYMLDFYLASIDQRDGKMIFQVNGETIKSNDGVEEIVFDGTTDSWHDFKRFSKKIRLQKNTNTLRLISAAPKHLNIDKIFIYRYKDKPPPSIIGFELVAVSSGPHVAGDDLGPLLVDDNNIVNLTATPQFNIRAETLPVRVGSVEFEILVYNKPITSRQENDWPYTAGGDTPIGTYLPMSLPPGDFTLLATPYSGNNLSGIAGPTREVNLSVISESYNVISSGRWYTCWLRSDSSVECWGDDYWGQASPPGGTFIQISAGMFHNCGVTSDGSVECWGWDVAGESRPPEGVFKHVSAGNAHTCGVRSDGSVECWGGDLHGKSSPPDGKFIQVAAGRDHTCGVRSNGSVECWGGDVVGESSPPDGTFIQFAAGDSHNCGVRRDGSVECWGWNNVGQSSSPDGKFIQVSPGVWHTCGVRDDGSVECWGRDNAGSTSPPDGTFIQVAAGRNHTCGVRSNGSVECWGRDEYGQSSPPIN